MRVRLRDGTGSRTYKYVVEDADRHGNVRIYLRRPGHSKVRLRETIGTPAFDNEYHAAFQNRPAPTSRSKSPSTSSLEWLIKAYYQSVEFASLHHRTKYVRRGVLDRIVRTHGTKPFALLEAKHIRKNFRDPKMETPESANAEIKALRQVFKWALNEDLVGNNPALDVPYLKSKNPDGFHTWTASEILMFMERHPIATKAYLALALGLFTGVRRSDAVLLGPQHETKGCLYFTETKGRTRNPKPRELPILPDLRAAIDAFPSNHLTYLVTDFGKSFTPNGFGNWFKKRCREAGLDHCSFHGLRKGGAAMAAERGATAHQLMAIYGWTTLKEAARYTERADRKKLAADAVHYLSWDQDENKNVPLFGSEAISGAKPGEKP